MASAAFARLRTKNLSIANEDELVRAETGRTLHEKGRILPVCQRDGDEERCYAAAVATVLRNDLGGPRAAAKTMVRWTSAGERAAKTWLGGITCPIGEHVIGRMPA